MATDRNDAENAAPVLGPGCTPSQHLLSQVLLEAVDLPAGRTNAGKFNHGRFAQMKPRPQGQVLQVEADRRDVLAEFPGRDEVSVMAKLRKQLGGNEMNLTLVGKKRQSSRQKPVLGVLAGMRVSDNAVAFDERDAFFCLLRKPVL